jgi:hypothetical protein
MHFSLKYGRALKTLKIYTERKEPDWASLVRGCVNPKPEKEDRWLTMQ